MTFDELSTLLARLAFTTSDPGSKSLYNVAPSIGVQRDTVLKEFIYFKAFLAYYICANSARSNNIREAEQVTKSMLLKLGNAFDKDPFGYGCNYDELMNRFSTYYRNVNIKIESSLTNEFAKRVLSYNFQNNPGKIVLLATVIKETEEWMLSELQRPQTSNISSGSNNGSVSWTKIILLIVVCIAIYHSCFSKPTVQQKKPYKKTYNRYSFVIEAPSQTRILKCLNMPK